MTELPHSSSVESAEGSASRVARIGLLAGPLLAVAVYWLMPAAGETLTSEGRATAAVGVLMAAWWMTEALPLAVTALLPLVLFPVLGVMSLPESATPYADKFIFLFLGGFLIALAMERWNLHRRIALTIVSAVGAEPGRLIGGFMLATAALSMWISNTATTVMMLPMAVSVADLLGRRWQQTIAAAGEATVSDTPQLRVALKNIDNFGASLLLGVAYAASIGGVGTLIGTPPNTIMAAFLKENGVEIGFAQWMLLGVPLAAVFLLIAWLLLTRLLFPVRVSRIPGGRELIAAELHKLGRMSRGEWAVAVVFVLTALAWVTRGFIGKLAVVAEHAPWLARVDDTTIALGAAIALFMIPVDWRSGTAAMDWQTARRLPYEILLLFGGGLSLAAAVKQSGLADWIGEGVTSIPIGSVLAMIVVVTAVVVFLTELTSNTATATLFMPLLLAAAGNVTIGDTVGVHPLLLIVPAALAASCAFMLPVATPPNAVVFGSGKIRIGQMAWAGWWLNVAAIVLIPLLIYLLAPLVFGVSVGR